MTTTTHNKTPGMVVLVATIAGLVLAAISLLPLGPGHSALGVAFDTEADEAAEADKQEAPKALRGIHYDPPRQAPALDGLDHNGQSFSLKRQPHPLAMVFFGYVSCTDVCPTNLKKFEKIQKQLGADADQVQFVFVTIDPGNEPPKKMAEYLEYYEGEIIGVTGPYGDSLDEVYKSWGIVRKRVELDKPVMGRDYKFDHSGQIYLVQNGKKMPVSYPYGTSVDTMVEDLSALLDDPSLGERLPEVGSVKKVTIPPGSYTRAAQKNPKLPAYLRVRVGDSIRWRNDDYMYHFVGDISLGPGEEATQRFDEAGEFYFGCTALPSEVIRIAVEEPSTDG
ncbi:SCO family protein [Persicimonas caeni]|nr:SCO family protein [Persicimonas caeni]